MGFGSYFDGHLAITPFGLTENPWGSSCPDNDHFRAVLERVGDDAGVLGVDHGAVVLDLNRYSRVFGLTILDPGTT